MPLAQCSLSGRILAQCVQLFAQRCFDGLSVELDQTRVGRLSRMDAMQQQAMSQAVARLTDLERQRILSALGRMESGDYGYCVICDEKIVEERLRFDPSVLVNLPLLVPQ